MVGSPTGMKSPNEPSNRDSEFHALSQAIAALPPRPGDELAIFVPSKDRHGLAIDQSYWMERSLRLLGRLFGGASAIVAQGIYRGESAKLIREQTIIVACAVELAAVQSKADILEVFLRRFCDEGNQEEAGLLINRHYIAVRGGAD